MSEYRVMMEIADAVRNAQQEYVEYKDKEMVGVTHYSLQESIAVAIEKKANELF